MRLALFFLIFLTILFMVSCNPRSNFTPEWDSNFSELRVTPRLFENEREMKLALKERLNREPPEGLLGMAIMSPDDNICEIYAVKPKHIDDRHTKTIGHEFLHCVYGRYHSE